jgi:hypothetical protein
VRLCAQNAGKLIARRFREIDQRTQSSAEGIDETMPDDAEKRFDQIFDSGSS